MSRRPGEVYNEKRFLVNKSTGHIHDLDNETEACMIDAICKNHVKMLDTETEVASQLNANSIWVEYNGCQNCLSQFYKEKL